MGFEIGLDRLRGCRVSLGRRRCSVSVGAPEKRLEHARRIGPLLLDGLDIEAQSRQRFGETLEVFALRIMPRRIAIDLLLAAIEQRTRLVETEDLQRAPDLPGVAPKARELAALGGIAEEGVEHLLDMAKVGLDLARDACQQQPFLCAARGLVEQLLAGTGE